MYFPWCIVIVLSIFQLFVTHLCKIHSYVEWELMMMMMMMMMMYSLDDNNVYDALIDAPSPHSGLILSRKTIFGKHVKQSNCHNLRTH